MKMNKLVKNLKGITYLQAMRKLLKKAILVTQCQFIPPFMKCLRKCERRSAWLDGKGKGWK